MRRQAHRSLGVAGAGLRRISEDAQLDSGLNGSPHVCAGIIQLGWLSRFSPRFQPGPFYVMEN
jgi:hypothetical protein